MRRPLLQFVTQLEKIQLTPGAHGQRGVMRAARWKKKKGRNRVGRARVFLQLGRKGNPRPR